MDTILQRSDELLCRKNNSHCARDIISHAYADNKIVRLKSSPFPRKTIGWCIFQSLCKILIILVKTKIKTFWNGRKTWYAENTTLLFFENLKLIKQISINTYPKCRITCSLIFQVSNNVLFNFYEYIIFGTKLPYRVISFFWNLYISTG